MALRALSGASTSKETSPCVRVAQTANGQCVAYSKNPNDSAGFPIYCGGEYIGALADGTKEKTENGGGTTDYTFKLDPDVGLIVLYHGIAVDTLTDGAQGEIGDTGDKGDKGLTGAQGLQGESCEAEEVATGIKVTCAGEVIGIIKHGEDGAAGESCTARPTLNGVDILCGNLKVGSLMNGENGESCQVEAVTTTTHKDYYGEFDYIVLCGGEFNGGLRNGKDGVSCAVVQVAGGAEITCGTETVKINDGLDGAPCIVTEVSGGLNVTCNGETKFLRDGQNGLTGPQGENCIIKDSTIAQVHGAYITCGTSSVFIKDGYDGVVGKDGSVCAVTNLIENNLIVGATVTCTSPDGLATSVNITNGRDGANGQDGQDGVNGADGTSCIANPVMDLMGIVTGVNIVCGENDPVYLAKGKDGADGANGANGADGLGCSVSGETQHLIDGKTYTGYEITCGTQAPVFVRNGIDGKDGASCLASDWVENQVIKGVKIVCGTQSPFYLYNGKDGANGVDGAQGVQGEKGASCKAEAVIDNGVQTGVNILCDGQAAVFLPKGDKGETGDKGDKGDTGAQGVQGVSCSVGDASVENGITGYWITCGTSRQFIKDGVGCSVEPWLDGITVLGVNVICGTQVQQLAKGADGRDGLKGDKGDTGDAGTSCIGEKNTTDLSITISCGGAVVGVLEQGAKGETGATGDAGAYCTIAETSTSQYNTYLNDGYAYVILCGTTEANLTVTGALRHGRDGTSCTVSKTGSVATISCTDGTSVSISDGVNGLNGEKGDQGIAGDNGESCTSSAITDNLGNIIAVEITCPDQSPVRLNKGTDGAAGASCILGSEELDATSGVTGYKLTCGTTEVFIKNGRSCSAVDWVDTDGSTVLGYKVTCGEDDPFYLKNGTDGATGAVGPQGESCKAEVVVDDNNAQTGVNIICGSNAPVFLPKGATGATGAQGVQGEMGLGCTVGPEIVQGTRTGFQITCGTNDPVFVTNGLDGTSCESAVWQDANDPTKNLGVMVRCGTEDWKYISNGAEGAKGADGASCVAAKEMGNDNLPTGNVIITCGTNDPIILAKGEKGDKGDQGDQGASCNVEEVTSSLNSEYLASGLAYIIKCGGVYAGGLRNGESCSVTENLTGAKITCAGTTPIQINHGTNGIDGADGDDGTSCTAQSVIVQGVNLGVNITCGSNPAVFLENVHGATGVSCSIGSEVENHGELGYWITCGEPNAAGFTQAFIKHGTSCFASTLADGSGVSIKCGSNSEVILKHGEKGETGLRGPAGTSCRGVYNNADSSVTISCQQIPEGDFETVGTLLPKKGDKGDGCEAVYLTTATINALALDPEETATLREYLADQYSYGIVCGGKAQGALRNGASCTVEQRGEYGVRVSCDDGSTEFMNNCRPRAADNGIILSCGSDIDSKLEEIYVASCSMQEFKMGDISYGATITCGNESLDDDTYSSVFFPQKHCAVKQDGLTTKISCSEGQSNLTIAETSTADIYSCRVERLMENGADANGIKVTCGNDVQTIKGCSVREVQSSTNLNLVMGLLVNCGEGDSRSEAFIAQTNCSVTDNNMVSTLTCSVGAKDGSSTNVLNTTIEHCKVSYTSDNLGLDVQCGNTDPVTIKGCRVAENTSNGKVQGSEITCGYDATESKVWIPREWCEPNRLTGSNAHVVEINCYKGVKGGTETKEQTERLVDGDNCRTEQSGNNLVINCGPGDSTVTTSTLHGCTVADVTVNNQKQGIKVSCGEKEYTTSAFLPQTTCTVAGSAAGAIVSCYTGKENGDGTTTDQQLEGCTAAMVPETNNVKITCGGTEQILVGCSMTPGTDTYNDKGYHLTCGNDTVFVKYGLHNEP